MVDDPWPPQPLGGDHRLALQFGSDEWRVRDLLTPLAWAQGDGLADIELWAALATELGAARYRSQDVIWLLEATAAADLLHRVQPQPDGLAAYRLFHEALAKQLRARPRLGRSIRAVRSARSAIPCIEADHTDTGTTAKTSHSRAWPMVTRAVAFKRTDPACTNPNTLLDGVVFVSG